MKSTAKRLSATVLAATLAVSTIPARADWIGDFYNAAGAGSNVTPPGAIATQNVLGYSGGGLAWRVPNKNLSPLQINPPSIKAGCGGIDAYLGAFSFPNKDEFVQSLRNFGQAAVGYFFELALRTMAPEIAVTLDVINDLATRVNQFSINSCNAAKKAVDGLAGDWMRANARDATGYARSMGKYVDEFAANFGLSTNVTQVMEEKYEQNYGKSKAAVTSADYGKFAPVRTNVLWWALNHANGAVSGLTDEEMELIMSMVGPTVIFGEANASDGTPNGVMLPGKAATLSFTDLVGGKAILSASGPQTTLKVLKCGDAECLKVIEATENIDTFARRVGKTIIAIQTAIDNRVTPTFSASDAAVIQLTSVPLHRAASLSRGVSVGSVVSDQILTDLADYAAYDAAYRFVSYYLNEAEKAFQVAAPKLPDKGNDELKAMTHRINVIRDEMNKQIMLFYRDRGDPYQKIEHLDRIERAMYGNLNYTLAANSRFGKR